MKCKYCQTEWAEEGLICPNCGQTVQDETADEVSVTEEQIIAEAVTIDIAAEEKLNQQASKSGGNWWKIMLIALAGAILGTILTILILLGSGVPFSGTEQETQPTQIPTQAYDTYYTDDQTAKDKVAEIVATAGNSALNNGRFQVYYWSTFLTFLQNNGTYYFDLAQPVGSQYVSDGVSWESYFVDGAINSWHCYAALGQLAESEGFVLSAEQQEYLENLPVYLESVALDNGYENAQVLVEVEFGPGATLEDYVQYMREYTLALEYYNAKYEEFAPTQDEIEAFFAENEQSYAASGVTRESKVVDVRHILVKFKSESGDAEYTDEEKAACKAEAQAILDQWLAGDANEDSFAALAEEFSEDPGSKDNGGLYEDVAKDYMVETFDAWIFDGIRQVGDYGIVETNYGFHVMFFSGSKLEWPALAEADLIEQMAQKLLMGSMDIWPADVHYDNIVIGNVDLGV